MLISRAFEHRHEGCEHSYADRNKEIQQKHIEASKAVISVATTFEANLETSKVAALIRSLQLLEKDHLHGVRIVQTSFLATESPKKPTDKNFVLESFLFLDYRVIHNAAEICR